jgi:hypothetical protein
MIRWVALVGVLTAPGALLADEASVCIERNENAQSLRSRGDLLAARPLAVACSQGCPAAIATDCTELASRIEQETPTVIFGATRGGKDLVAVRVKRGDETLATSLTGQPQRMNPGPVKLEFLSEDGVARALEIVLKTGEKNRLVTVELASEPAAIVAPPVAPPPSAPPVEPAADGSDLPPAIFWVLGSVSVATFAGAAVAGAIALDRRSDLDPCIASKTCSVDDVEAVERTALVTDVLLGAGAALAVGAVLSWVFWPSEPNEPPARIGFVVGPAGASAAAGWEW